MLSLMVISGHPQGYEIWDMEIIGDSLCHFVYLCAT